MGVCWKQTEAANAAISLLDPSVSILYLIAEFSRLASTLARKVLVGRLLTSKAHHMTREPRHKTSVLFQAFLSPASVPRHTNFHFAQLSAPQNFFAVWFTSRAFPCLRLHSIIQLTRWRRTCLSKSVRHTSETFVTAMAQMRATRASASFAEATRAC